MRILTIAALIGFSSLLLASQTAALSLIRLDYTGGSTAAPGSGGSSVAANVGDTLSFDISVDVDAAELGVISFSLLWNYNPGLVLYNANWETGQKLTNLSPLTAVTLIDPQAPVPGAIHDIGWLAIIDLFPASTNVFLGSVTLQVQQAEVPSNVTTGLFDYNTAVALDGSLALVTPDFTSFVVNPAVPEPTTALLLGLGLAGLRVASRLRSKNPA